LLVALPQSPERRRLDRYPEAAHAARDRVLARMVEDGVVSKDDAAQARAAAVPRLRKPMPILAPHSSDAAMATVKDTPLIKLTLDSALQKTLEALARDRAVAQGPNISVAIIAVDNESGDVLARVGSSDYFDERRAGQVDMTRAVRSPGSTLKAVHLWPRLRGRLCAPESLIDDRPIRFGSYAPENFDMTFQGTVPVRKALQLSLNVPAIALLDRVGSSRLSSRLKQAGGNLVLPKDEAPGLAMGLGGVGISLQDLAQLYAGLARLRRGKAAARDHAGQRRSRAAAADGPGRGLAGRQRAARDAAAGKRRAQQNRVQDRHQLRLSRCVVGRFRWPHHDRRVGRASRRRAGAGPGRPHRRSPDPVRRVCAHRKDPGGAAEGAEGALIAGNAKLPLPLRRFRPVGELIRTGSDQMPRIQFPLNGSRIDVDRSGGGQAAPMPVKVAGGVLPLTDHAERHLGRRNRQPAPAAGRPARARFCPPDGDRRDGGGRYRCDPGTVRKSAWDHRLGESVVLFAVRFHRMRTRWLKPCNPHALERANSL
jgi:penicillin-binding protein 1C